MTDDCLPMVRSLITNAALDLRDAQHALHLDARGAHALSSIAASLIAIATMIEAQEAAK